MLDGDLSRGDQSVIARARETAHVLYAGERVAHQSAGAMRWVRLPLQFVLMAWAWWYTRPDVAHPATPTG
jgi:hypothetical protein